MTLHTKSTHTTHIQTPTHTHTLTRRYVSLWDLWWMAFRRDETLSTLTYTRLILRDFKSVGHTPLVYVKLCDLLTTSVLFITTRAHLCESCVNPITIKIKLRYLVCGWNSEMFGCKCLVKTFPRLEILPVTNSSLTENTAIFRASWVECSDLPSSLVTLSVCHEDLRKAWRFLIEFH